MKKIKNKWQVWVNALLTTIMGWLAMSCDLAPMYGPPLNLYAPPAPDPESYLVVEGKVVDEVGRPLANILLFAQHPAPHALRMQYPRLKALLSKTKKLFSCYCNFSLQRYGFFLRYAIVYLNYSPSVQPKHSFSTPLTTKQ